MADPEVTTIGVIFKRRVSTGPDVYTAIPGVFNISPPTQAWDDIEVTHFGDTVRRFKPGLPDNGEISVQYNWLPADTQQVALVTAATARTLNSYRLEWPSAAGAASAGGTDTFEAYVKSVSRDAVVINGRLTRTAVFRISGAITEV